MKRFIAILLLNVHLFNLGGYQFVFQYFIHQSEVQIVKEIYENKIDATKLVEIKIPVHLPGIKKWDHYVRDNGQLQLKGVYYNYLRYKMSPDTMSFICIANSVKTRLVSANLVIAKEINDVPLSKKGHDSLKKSGTGNDYSFQVIDYQFIAFSTQLKAVASPIAYHVNDPYIESPGKPPNFTC
ncbi:hypothetical protein [Mucilaginibacter ginsenosidivorax]|uniref:Uncharacterized protein n=1 Tax=Mucilaginibacter ginsenosidivorax TaxID=862126 RepID=A0A5B8VT75_9SPHI|nr:hypothetical protein [Mucilaginibacter ginsenosidivorax]QEC74483.1 hypothetical protein FSB76_00410 [Mucilaginibacter ginsenosidivorax]